MSKLLLTLSLLPILLLSAAAHGGHDADSDSPPPNLRAKSLILVKIWCLILVFIGTFAGGVLPYFFKLNEGFLVLGTQFAGGVFLGTAMMHFLSDSNEMFGDLTSKAYPFAFMLACAGYLVTMLADYARVHGKNGSGDGGGSHSGDVEVQVPLLSLSPSGSQPFPQKRYSHLSKSAREVSLISSKSVIPATTRNKKGGTKGTTAESQYQVKAPLSTSASSLGDSILLIVALCFHSVFKGIAIGVAETKADAWKALWTICLHKIFAAIAMGIALLRILPNRPLQSCAAYAFAFAISSPIGVAIAIIIDATTLVVASWIYGISMGLACGVFIYVSINHLLAKRYLPQKLVSVDTPFYKFSAVLLGIGAIAVVMIWDT